MIEISSSVEDPEIFLAAGSELFKVGCSEEAASVAMMFSQPRAGEDED